MTAAVPTVIEAMQQVMAEVTSVEKGDRFDGGDRGAKFNFRGVDRVVKALSAAIRKNKVLVIPEKTVSSWQPVTTAGGKPAGRTEVTVTYRIYGPAGDSIPMEVPGEAFDNGDKSTSKAMSVAWRTGLLQAFFLPTGDPDPDSQEYVMGAPQEGVRGFRGTAAAVQRTEARDQVLADWHAAVDAVATDYAGLGNLLTQARSKRAPQEIIDRIMKLGNEAKPK